MVRLKIQEVAEAKGISMSKLHRSADITYRTIRQIYSNPYRDINLSTLEKLAKALGVSICDLIEELPDN
ncbi:MAG TPA: helix-turn-helix transcriptional regulator [Ktedonobacteraceae bacterium]|nr:helix-turn-helix transcriptional regulator [Ktedonobacteraceae bacterium]